MSHTHGPYSSGFPSTDFGITEHKHDEQTDYQGPEEDLPLVGVTVVSVRDPYAWVNSMSKNIYGGQKRNAFSLRADERYEEALERFLSTSWEGGDHVFNATYKDLFDMRYRKICNHVQSALRYSQYVLYLRQEDDVSETSKLSVVDTISRLGWPLKGVNGDVDMLRGEYVGHSGWIAHKEPKDEDALVDAVNRHADWAFERILGYLRRDADHVQSQTIDVGT